MKTNEATSNPFLLPTPTDAEFVGARVVADSAVFPVFGTVVAVGEDRICGAIPVQVRWDDGEESEEYGPELATTLRRELLLRHPGGFYSHRLAAVYKDRHNTRARAAADESAPDSECSADRWDVREWCGVGRESLADVDALCIAPDYSTENTFEEDLVASANEAAWKDRAEWEALGGYLGGSLVLWLDVEVPQSVAESACEALDSLESYPILDEEAHSMLEIEASSEEWEDYGRTDTVEALRELLALSEDDGWCIDVEPETDDEGRQVGPLADVDFNLYRAATENCVRLSDGFNAKETAKRWIVAQARAEDRSGEPWKDWHDADRVRLAKPRAVAALIRTGALRLYVETPEPAVLERLGGLRGVSVNEDRNREALRSLPGIIDPDPDRAAEVSEPDGFRNVLAALGIIGREQDRTGELPMG